MISKRTLFKLAFVIALIIISYLVFSKPNYPQSIPHLDKMGHLGGFFILSLLSHLAFKLRWYLVVIILASYALLIELIQGQLTYRTASVGDFIADMLGVALFYLCLFFIRWIKQTHDSHSQ